MTLAEIETLDHYELRRYMREVQMSGGGISEYGYAAQRAMRKATMSGRGIQTGKELVEAILSDLERS